MQRTTIERITQVVRYHLLKGRFSNDTTAHGGMGEWYGWDISADESAMYIPQLAHGGEPFLVGIYLPKHAIVHVEILETETREGERFWFNALTGEQVEFAQLPEEVQNR